MLEGIDISSHQDTTPSLAGKAFVIVRATYGAHADNHYFIHEPAVRRAGRVLGAYHFSRPVSTGDTVAEQVRAFLLMARGADLLFLDWETDGRNGRMTAADARAFIAAVHDAGRLIGLYASESWFADLGQDYDWVANYSREPRRAWDIWQYRGSPLDLDRFDGTVDELRALGRTLPDSSTEDPMIGFTIRGDAPPGSVRVTTGTAAVTFQPSGRVVGIPAGSEFRVYAIVRRVDNGIDCYLVGIPDAGPPATIIPAFLPLADAAPVVVPPPVVDCDDVVAAELRAAAQRVLTRGV